MKSEMTDDEMRKFMQKEAHRTKPDYICYTPGSFDYRTNDSANEHFLVFEGGDGSMMAVWTQTVASRNGHRNRAVFSKSKDDGKTWSTPVHIAGPKNLADKTKFANWAYPMVSKSGRIYVLWNQNQNITGWIRFHTGTMSGAYSDDHGKTWSKPQDIPMPKSPYSDPDGKQPDEWIVWQKPERAPDGKYFVGYTHWLNEDKAFYNKQTKPPGWTWIESVVEFMKYENIDDNPEPKDLKITYSAWGDKALRVPHYLEPRLSIAQEPSIVTLPDGRLFTTIRSGSGYIWYSVSNDNGKTWINPRPLLRKDHGRPILQPVACCPIYKMSDGRFVLLHHNNRGDTTSPDKISTPRNPAFIALGEYRPNGDQPIWFSESKLFLDNGTTGPDRKKDNIGNVAVYTSFTTRKGKNILWYPDAKCWLLGKEVTKEFLADLTVPK